MARQSIDIFDLLGAVDARQFGAVGNNNRDDAAHINEALVWAAAHSVQENLGGEQPASSVVCIPPGTYRCDTPIIVPSGVTLIGFGSMSVLKLGPSMYDDVLKSTGTSNVRIANLRIDGNRANNVLGTRQGVWLYNVTDGWLDNVEAVSCRADGFRLDVCERVELRGCKASDNGRHGVSISYSFGCQLSNCRAYDNCKVSTTGTADGFNLELLSSDNTLNGCSGYETARYTGAVGSAQQGYGAREAPGEGCAHTLILGGAYVGNQYAGVSLDAGDSAAVTMPLVQIPMGAVITP